MLIFEVRHGDGRRLFPTRRAAKNFMQQYIDAGVLVTLDVYPAPETPQGWCDFLNARGKTLVGITGKADRPSSKRLTITYTPEDRSK